MGCVFMITCVPTGEFYIGGTKQKYKDIIQDYKYALAHDKCGFKLMQKAWNTYGEEAFEFRILKMFPNEEVAAKRLEAITRLKPVFNNQQTIDLMAMSEETGIPLGLLRYRKKHGLGLEQSSVAVYEVDGQMMPIKDIAAKYGISVHTLYYRTKCGVRGPALVEKRPRGRSKRVRRTVDNHC